MVSLARFETNIKPTSLVWLFLRAVLGHLVEERPFVSVCVDVTPFRSGPKGNSSVFNE